MKMPSCVVCNGVNNVNHGKFLDDVYPTEADRGTVRSRLERVLGEAVCQAGWICTMCYPDLIQIEDYYIILKKFKQRYWDTTRKNEELRNNQPESKPLQNVFAQVTDTHLIDTLLVNPSGVCQFSGDDPCVKTDVEGEVTEVCYTRTLHTNENVKVKEELSLKVLGGDNISDEPQFDESDSEQPMDDELEDPDWEDTFTEQHTLKFTLSEETQTKDTHLIESQEEQNVSEKLHGDGSDTESRKIATYPSSSSVSKSIGRFKCTLCIAGFKRNTSLKNHMKKHVKETEIVFSEPNLGRPKHVGGTTELRRNSDSPLETSDSGLKDPKIEVDSLEEIYENQSKDTESNTTQKGLATITLDISYKTKSGVEESKPSDKTDSTLMLSDEKGRICLVCKKEFRCAAALRRHRTVHTGERPFKCDQCDKTYKDSSHLKNHMEVHSIGKISCSVCSKDMPSLRSLRVHMKTTHKEKRKCICAVCSKEFVNDGQLKKHMMVHTGERPYPCDICQKGFRFRRDVKIHKRKHFDERPYTCESCDASFKHRSQLISHNRIHTGETFPCTVCDKEFTIKNSLMIHMRTHTGEKPFTCVVCSKGYRSQSSLYIHTKIHSGENQAKDEHMCWLCGKVFTRNSMLKIHLMSHSGEKKYSCELCGKGFITNQSYKLHMRTHTGDKPYKCNKCGKRFSQNSSLNTHMYSHASVRAFTCKMCGKSFRAPCTLRHHMKLHTGVRPHECKTCHKTFTEAYHLRRHALCHTKEDSTTLNTTE